MNKATPGPCKEVTPGPGPHGGVVTVAYYFNSKYAPVPKDQATRIIVHEYDEKGRSLWRDYLSCGPNDEEEYAAMEAYELSDKPQPPQQFPKKRDDSSRPRREGSRSYREGRESQEPRESRAPREPRQPRESRENRDGQPQRQRSSQPRPRREGQPRKSGSHPAAAPQASSQEAPRQEGTAPRRPRRRRPRRPSGPKTPQKDGE